MNIGEYGQMIAPISGAIGNNVAAIYIAAATGAIDREVAAIRVVKPDGTWSDEIQVGMLGDVNGDGEVNISDYTLIRYHIENLQTLTGAALVRADVNRDGVVTEADKTLVNNYILGL